MRELLTSLRNPFDVIVIDTPPLLPTPCAALATSQAHGAVLVVRYTRLAPVISAIVGWESEGAASSIQVGRISWKTVGTRPAARKAIFGLAVLLGAMHLVGGVRAARNRGPRN